MKKFISLFTLAFCCLFLSMEANAVPVTVTGETNTTPNLSTSYSTLADAITALNGITSISGQVVLTCDPSGSEIAPAVLGTAGSGYSISFTAVTSASNNIVIDGNGSTITANTGLVVGNLNDAIFKLIGADYVTIQNFIMTESANSVNTPAASNNMTEWGVAFIYKNLTDGAQNNTIQNNTISLKRVYLNTFGIYSNTRHSNTSIATSAEVTAASGSNSGNKVYGNNISNVNYGIVFIGAGTTIAAIDNGNDIGGNSVSTGNTISNWGGGSALSGYISLTGSNYCIFDNQQINENVSYNTITSAPGLTILSTTFGGFLKNYSVASPGGTITTNINNNSVTLTNSPTTGAMIGINSQGLTANSNATFSMNNNTVSNCLITGSPTSASFTGITNLSAPGVLNMTNNVINGIISASTTGGFTGISSSGAVVNTVNINNNEIGTDASGAAIFTSTTSAQINSIINTGGAVTSTINLNNNIIRGFSLQGSGQITSVSNQASLPIAINIKDNQVGTANSNSYTFNSASSGAVVPFFNSAGNAAGLLTITGNNITRIVNNITGTSSHSYIQNQTYTGSTNISNNSFTNITANITGNVTFISNSVTHAAGSSQNVDNNTVVIAYNKIGSGGTVLFYNAFGSSPATVTETNTGNNFSNMTFVGTTSIAGWRSADGTTPGSRKSITNNTFDNINGGTGSISSILYVGFSDNTYPSNNVTGNIISYITSDGAIVGFLSDGQNQNFYNNSIHDLTSSGAGVVTAISYTGATVQNCYNNEIHSLYSNNSGGSVNGVLISSGTTFNIFNNTIGNLNANYTSSSSDAIRGISITSTTSSSSINLTYNNIYIPSQVTFGINFSSAAIFATSSATATTAQLTMRNNVLCNSSAPTGTGTCVVFRRSSGTANTLANYNANSNQNLFYIANPGGSNLVYSDGVSTAQTFTDYKNGVFTAGTVAPRDNYSLFGDPSFPTAIVLIPNPASLNSWFMNGNGIAINSIGTDIAGNPRSTTIQGGGTDIGAYEFDPTVDPPVISVTPTIASDLAVSDFYLGEQYLTSIDVTTLGSLSNVDLQYYSGTEPVGLPGSPPVTDGYGDVYWDIQPTGTGFTYDLVIHYSPALLGNIVESAIKVAIEDPPNNGQGLYTPYLQGTGTGESDVDFTNKTITVRGLTAMGRFIITDASDALPIELASFVSTVNGRNVELNWATASENNNSGFDVERSSENGTWSKLSNISGNGTSSISHSYSFTDRNLSSGNYSYRLKQIDFNGNFEYFNLSNEVNIGIPSAFNLSQNYPNPFNPSTKINYDLSADSKISIKLYDMSGKEVMTLVNEAKTAGYYSINFNASNLSSGIYFYTISAGNFVDTKKMTLIK